MTPDAPQPGFQIERMYVKGLVLDQPHAPAILLAAGEPALTVALDVGTTAVGDDLHEVVVAADVRTVLDDRLLLGVRAHQAGIFRISGVPHPQLDAILAVTCPQMIYPYLRATVADACTRAGFAPIVLTEVDFVAWAQQRADQSGSAGLAASADPSHRDASVGAAGPGAGTEPPARDLPAAYRAA